MHTEIRQSEEGLRQAMLTSNVAELDALIDDRLMFVGPDGSVYSKSDDLELHRSGAQQMSRAEFADIRIELHGGTAVTTVLANLAGIFKGQAFDGKFRYIRTWVREEHGWCIVAGSVCAIP